MKFALAIAVVSAVGVLAAPHPSPSPWCFRRYAMCFKLKRAVGAFSEAVQTSKALETRSVGTAADGAALTAKLAVHEMAHLMALATDDPNAFIKDLGLDDGSPAPSKTTSEGASKEDGGCQAEGGACWAAKRAADAVLEAIGDDSEEPAPGSLDRRDAEARAECFRPGAECWKAKRDLYALKTAARQVSSSY
ncbi:hypothetical protein CDD83_1365 [Cordyceps sp. RAO-2017]|nr:hypothetical protein CDD83_1365 [Cordyceps sp. RAO-2017]